jgi:pimeloyl-ACP methyl ester carboxylesterase
MDTQEITLHGNHVSYRTAGDGPEVVVLIHGITGSADTWAEVIPALAEEFTVVAPDLLGHGHSAKPRGDYSLGAYASGVRDLVAALGHDHATIVGHSLGGGVAMQLAYQFPERCDRLVLVSSGGLGRDVHPLLRAAALPGSEFVLPLICATKLRDAGDAVWGALGRLGLNAGPDLDEMWRGYASLADRDAQQAFVHTLRTIVDGGGQRVNATDRLYLAAEVPTLLVWGKADRIIPVEHGIEAQEAIPGSRLEVFEGAGHFPHRSDPDRFTDALIDFIEHTVPAEVDEDRWREMLRAGAPA